MKDNEAREAGSLPVSKACDEFDAAGRIG